MKRFWEPFTAIGIVLALTFSSTPAMAAIPAVGGTCKTVSQKVVVKGKTLVCLKVGKKLAWKVAASKPVIPTGPKIPTSFTLPLNFDNLSSDTAEISFLLVKQAFDKSKPVTVTNRIVKGPGANATYMQHSLSYLERAMNLLGSYWKPEKITSIFFGVKDDAWIDQAIVDAGGNPLQVTSDLKPFSIKLREGVDPYCSLGVAQSTANGPLWIQCIGDDSFKDFSNTVAAHEYFHFFQQSFRGNEQKIQWADEGTANYFGSVVGLYLASKTPSDIWDFRTNQRGSFDAELLSLIHKGDVKGIAARFKKLESSSNPEIDGSGYLLGQYASEVLIAVGGWDRFMQLNIRMGSKASFADTFESLYGTTLDDFYPKVAAYVLKQR